MADAPVKKKSSPGRTLVTLLMDALVVVAIVLLAHLVISFFGQLADQPWAVGVLSLTGRLVVPAGVTPIATPYDGVFDIDASITILLLLAGEWVLGMVRRTV